MNQYKLNIRNIEAFKNINPLSIKKIEESAKIIQYKIGEPICENIIPQNVLLILQGKSRLLYKDKLGLKTLSILGKNDFIGLSSIINAKECEFVSASEDLIALSLPDNLIIDLYLNEKGFQNWCNSKILISEVSSTVISLSKDYPKDDFNLKYFIELIKNNAKIDIIKTNKSISSKNNLTSILISNNVEKIQPGKILNSNQILTIRGPLPARILCIPNNIYEQITLHQNKKSISQTEETDTSNLSFDINNGINSLAKSQVNIGQYEAKNNFKLIQANGTLQECIACLQMLANLEEIPYRRDSIEKMFREIHRDGKKPSLQLMGEIISTMGLHAYKANIASKMAERLPTPSLIAWKESFAIVTKSGSNILEIASPNEGLIVLNKDQFENNFDDNVIQLIKVEKSEQTPEKKFGVPWLLPAINRYRGSLILVLLASFIVQLFGLANPLMIQIIIDKVISQRSLDTLQVLGIAIVVITILGGILSSLRTFLFQETTNRIDTRLGSEIIDHLLRLPLNYFDRRPVGELGSRVAELEKIRNFLTGQALTTILDAAFSVIYIVVMVFYSWLLTLLALAVVPIQITLTLLGSPLIRRQIRAVAQENAKTQSHLVEVLTGIQTVKAQNVESVSRWKWQDLYTTFISKSFEKTITGTALGETSKVLQNLSQLLVLWVGASLVLAGKLSLGQLIAFRIISGYVTQPLLRLSTIWQNIQELRVSFERLADIVDTPEETSKEDKEKIPLPPIKGGVNFEDISFRFNPGTPNILENVTLEIKAGQFVGIVGQSGSGKSTLMKLLPRLYKPNSGKLFIDGYDINKVELYSLRRQIGIVPQEPLLFKGSINENIALTDPQAGSDEIVAAAKMADAHEFIMSLENGYSTQIGERGAGISGGQKQRIAIARTLLSQPKLLILDEATSALDYETEKNVCEGLIKSCSNSTVFFITHRLSTVKNSNLIVMLHQGSIVEKGTHKELMELKGRYFALYMQQEAG